MKKTIAILLSLVMILGLAACGNSASRTEQSSTEENPVSTESMEEPVEGSNTDVENTDASEVQSENADQKTRRRKQMRLMHRRGKFWLLTFLLPIYYEGRSGTYMYDAPGGVLLGICTDEYSFLFSLEHDPWNVQQTLGRKENDRCVRMADAFYSSFYRRVWGVLFP